MSRLSCTGLHIQNDIVHIAVQNVAIFLLLFKTRNLNILF